MIQHAGGGALRVVCLPRGLESCRYGGAVGVTFSGDSSGDRSSMPSEAMSSTVRNHGLVRRGGSWLRPSLRSARRSSQRLVVGAEVLRSSSAGDGSLEEAELCGAPRPSHMALRPGQRSCSLYVELRTGLCEGILFEKANRMN